ncbi:MAG: hypothetical protein IJY04_07570, partial [Clostridia bacterium]|nr:hypothetical protein [Clostridia bacterium]
KVEPMTAACGMPYRSEYGWKWDWHIIPGFAMGYLPHERERLADEAMRKFKEVFGYYPKTVGSWLFDTHTVNYLAENYNISAFFTCRDQINTDAYTLIGGYFNQAYYPSKNNFFTPAQTEEARLSTPVYRLLGSCPIRNYDGKKYCSDRLRDITGCYTLEPAWYSGTSEEFVDWIYKSYFINEDLGYSYAQIGQENSFSKCDLVTPLRMQIEKAKELPDVVFMKMRDTGDDFKRRFPNGTPPTSVVALDDWEGMDIQSVYYDCENYTANLFRYGKEIFFRSFYLFDERIKDRYEGSVCDTFDAVYENLPIVDTAVKRNERGGGLCLDKNAVPFNAEKVGEGELKVYWGDGKYVIFREASIEISCDGLFYDTVGATAEINADDGGYAFEYKGHSYRLNIDGEAKRSGFDFLGKHFVLTPERG